MQHTQTQHCEQVQQVTLTVQEDNVTKVFAFVYTHAPYSGHATVLDVEQVTNEGARHEELDPRRIQELQKVLRVHVRKRDKHHEKSTYYRIRGEKCPNCDTRPVSDRYRPRALRQKRYVIRTRANFV